MYQFRLCTLAACTYTGPRWVNEEGNSGFAPIVGREGITDEGKELQLGIDDRDA
jgi:hypothetical protein